MSGKQVEELNKKMDAIRKLSKAPSQYKVFLYLLGTGKSWTVKEIAANLDLTQKATERAIAKLFNRGLIQRVSFGRRSYTCDSNQILLGILLSVTDLMDRLDKRGK
jgi:predicted DNA-binding transcriptional regulator